MYRKTGWIILFIPNGKVRYQTAKERSYGNTIVYTRNDLMELTSALPWRLLQLIKGICRNRFFMLDFLIAVDQNTWPEFLDGSQLLFTRYPGNITVFKSTCQTPINHTYINSPGRPSGSPPLPIQHWQKLENQRRKHVPGAPMNPHITIYDPRFI